MTQSMYWTPEVPPHIDYVPDLLKNMLTNHYGDEFILSNQFDHGFITALITLKVIGARGILDAMNEHGSIKLKLEK